MKILVIDDMEYARCIMTKTLEKEGFEVDEAINGQQALQKISQNIYDVVLLDLILEDVSGIDLLDKIKVIDPNTQIIIITGQTNPKKLEECLDNGASHFFVKPFDTNELVSIIRN